MSTTNTTVGIDANDRHDFSLVMDVEDPAAVVNLDGQTSILARTPETLRKLAKTFDEAAVAFSAALDRKAANDINAARSVA